MSTLISANTGCVKALWVLPAALVLAACSVTEPNTARTPASSPTSTVVSAATPSVSATAGRSSHPTPEATKTPKSPHPISMQALINKKYDGRNLKLGRLLGDYGAYKRYMITYRGDGLKISGVMNIPDGRGPFPSWCSTMATSILTPTSPARACHASTTTWRDMATSCCTRTIAAMRHLRTT